MLEYDKPFKVTPEQHKALINKSRGILAGPLIDEQGIIWYKLWLTKYRGMIDQIIKTHDNNNRGSNL